MHKPLFARMSSHTPKVQVYVLLAFIRSPSNSATGERQLFLWKPSPETHGSVTDAQIETLGDWKWPNLVTYTQLVMIVPRCHAFDAIKHFGVWKRYRDYMHGAATSFQLSFPTSQLFSCKDRYSYPVYQLYISCPMMPWFSFFPSGCRASQ